MTRYHPGAGGMEVHLDQLVEGLNKRGHTIELLTTAHPDGRTHTKRDAVPVHFLEGTPPGVYSPAWSAASTAWIHRAHAERPFDLVLAESGAAHTYMEQTGPERRLPVVTVCHGFTGWTLAGRARHLQGWRSWRQLASLLLLYMRERFAWYSTRSIYDRVICVSDPLAEAYRREFRLDTERVIAIPNGLDMVRFQYSAVARTEIRRELALDTHMPVILVSGRLEYDKGVHLLLEATRDLPAQVLVAGDGPEAAALAIAASRPTVRFLGQVSNSYLARLHSASDLYAFPTMLNESFGYGVLEAMACGRPVVAPLTGAIPMLLEDGVTGIAFRSGDIAGLRRGLTALVADPDLRRRLGEQAARHVRARFSLESMLDHYELVIKSLSRQRAAPAPSAPPQLQS
jgi:glycosyltransferase involved in cell wall biosynthesis